MSEVKVNKLSPRSGTTVTLGDSGDTFAITSGASISGFTSTGIDDNATSTAITIDSSENVDIVGTTTSSNFISDGTGYGITFPLNGTATLNTNSNSVIFTGSGSSGDYLAGTLNLQSRGNLDRDINLITGATASNTLTAHGNGDISFYEVTGTTPKFFWDTSLKSIGINTTTPETALHVALSGTNYGGVNTGTEPGHVLTISSAGNGGAGRGTSMLFKSPGNSSSVTTAKIDALQNSQSSTANNANLVFNVANTSGSLTRRLLIGNGGDISFYEDTGTTAKLFWDASAERLGIGTSSPGANLHIESSSGETGTLIKTTASDTGVNLTLNGNRTSNTAGIGSIQFQNSGDSVGMIRSFRESANDAGGLAFWTQATGGSNTERMRINSSGNVGIGTSSPSSPNGADTFLQIGSNGQDVGIVLKDAVETWEIYMNDSLRIAYDTTEVMRFTNSGNVGIGTTSPSAKLHVDVSNSGVTPNSYANTLFIESSSNTGLTIASGTSSYSSIYFANSTDNDKARIEVVHSDNSMRFTNNAGERMRITSGGQFLYGKTSAGTAVNGIEFETNGKLVVSRSGTTGGTPVFINRNDNDGAMIIFRREDVEKGTISITGSSTNYNTSSDYRLKENVSYDFDATTRLKQLRPARFNFIADADTTVDGFLAHEVSSVVPEAISGTHNEVDADGNPVYQGIDQSKLVPLLVKTIQELEARITTLENA